MNENSKMKRRGFLTLIPAAAAACTAKVTHDAVLVEPKHGEPRTICAECRHLIRDRAGVIWYDLYCGNPSVRKPKKRDPVTGIILDDMADKHPHAREINRGDCPLWETTL